MSGPRSRLPTRRLDHPSIRHLPCTANRHVVQFGARRCSRERRPTAPRRPSSSSTGCSRKLRTGVSPRSLSATPPSSSSTVEWSFAILSPDVDALAGETAESNGRGRRGAPADRVRRGRGTAPPGTPAPERAPRARRHTALLAALWLLRRLHRSSAARWAQSAERQLEAAARWRNHRSGIARGALRAPHVRFLLALLILLSQTSG